MSIVTLPPLPPTVMLIGDGFMGRNHRQKVETLEAQGNARLVYVVDSDPSRLTALNVPASTSVAEAYANSLPDIIVICANTKSHFTLLAQIFDFSKKYGKVSHILIEKPLVANSKEGTTIQQLYSQYTGCISSGYLFRQSPIIAAGIQYLKENELTIKKVNTIWQKDRLEKGPPRPSEGVHIDEATHPADLIINCILPQAGIQADWVTILHSSYKKQSEVGQIVDQKRQEELYHDDPSKLDPIAEVNYTLDVGGIPITGFSSFKKAPQRREISLECINGTTLFFEFDVQGADHLYKITQDGEKALIMETREDKLMLEWEAFLNYCETGKESYRIQTFSNLLFDIKLTEALGQDLNLPIVLDMSYAK